MNLIEIIILNITNFYSYLFSADSFLMQPKINNYEIISIVWNIILLLVPYYVCKFLKYNWQKNKFKLYREKFIVILCGFIWLLFIPNAAYIMADLRHIVSPCILENYYHVCLIKTWIIFFFFLYSIIGWISMIYLIRQMKKLIKIIINEKISKLFVWLTIPLISLGLLLGLVQRWNSWEFFINPYLIFKDALTYFINGTYFLNWLLIAAILYILYFLGDYLFIDHEKI